MRLAILCLSFLGLHASGADKFLGWQSCGTSGCHGGGKGDEQVLIWKKQDIHSRAHATLISERSKRIAEALGIGPAEKSAQCTVCHSPMESVAPARLAEHLKAPNRGVSCESCHGPAEKWLLSHTRPDFTHAQRVALGLRDLDSPLQRANTCVGCHANVGAELLKAGHPTLRFELARQLVEMTPHWKDFDQRQSGAAWLTSQAALLRELCWLAEKGNAQTARITALHWVLRETAPGAEHLPVDAVPAALRVAADKLAKAASAQKWTAAKTREQFERIAKLGAQIGGADAFHRAEALTPALRGLALGLEPAIYARMKDTLTALDLAIRSQSAFDAAKYAELVAKLTQPAP